MLILEISLSGFSQDGRVCSGLCNIYFREIRITYSDLRRWFVKFFFLIRRRYVGYRIATTSSRDTYRVYLLRIKRAVKYPSHSPSLSSSFHHRTIQVSKTKVLVLFRKVCKRPQKFISRLVLLTTVLLLPRCEKGRYSSRTGRSILSSVVLVIIIPAR